MKRIAFLHVASILGGSERSFLDLVQHHDLNNENNLVILPDAGPLCDEIRKLAPRMQIIILPLPAAIAATTRKKPTGGALSIVLNLFSFIGYLWRLNSILRGHSTEILYTNGIKCHLISGLLPRGAAPKIIWHLQDFFPEIDFLKKAMSFLLRSPESIIANSTPVAKALETALPSTWMIGPNSVSIQVIPNAVSLADYSPQPLKRKRAGEPFRIAMIGMLTPWKGQHIFIEALHILKEKGHRVHGQIVGGEVYITQGESGYRAQLGKKVRDLHLTEEVEFLGLRNDIPEILHASDLFVHCSIRPEPFGRSIIEAMACGRPVIAARGGGVLDIIQHGQNGLLFQPGDPRDLAHQITEIMGSFELSERLMQNGLITVQNHFSANQFRAQIESNIAKLAS